MCVVDGAGLEADRAGAGLVNVVVGLMIGVDLEGEDGDEDENKDEDEGACWKDGDTMGNDISLFPTNASVKDLPPL